MGLAFVLFMAVVGASRGDAGAPRDAAAEIAPLDRSELQPARAPSDPREIAHAPYREAVQKDLVGRVPETALVMVVTTNGGLPERAVVVTPGPPGGSARVTVRRYRSHVWVAAYDWQRAQPALRNRVGPEVLRAALAHVSRAVDTARAEIDARTFEVLARVWNLMLDRARPDPLPRKVLIMDGANFLFQHGGRSAVARGRARGTPADRLTALGQLLIDYATAPPSERARRSDEVMAAATSLREEIERPAVAP
jgi:hypothetical protein